jgi:hypothetical protein
MLLSFQVFVNVRRNPNTPVFAVSSYNVTVSEYLNVQLVVQRVVATDTDPANTPSGQLVYSIVGVMYPNPAFNIAPNEADFIISPTTGRQLSAFLLIFPLLLIPHWGHSYCRLKRSAKVFCRGLEPRMF